MALDQHCATCASPSYCSGGYSHCVQKSTPMCGGKFRADDLCWWCLYSPRIMSLRDILGHEARLPSHFRNWLIRKKTTTFGTRMQHSN